MTISCGQCIECLLERSRHAAARILHESQLHEHNSFVTLTLEDKHLGENLSLNVRHWQLFAHRLRKAIRKEDVARGLSKTNYRKLRFYHAGEYSPFPRRRPHYHACLLGFDFSGDRESYTETEQGFTLYTSKTLDDLWSLGKCWIGDISFESAAYVARYCTSKVTGPNAEHFYNNTDYRTGEVTKLKPEYTTQSRRPGLGAKWIEEFYPEVYGNKQYLKDEIVVNGRKMRPPKYYDTYLEGIDPQHFKLIKARRIKEAEKHADDNTPERLQAKEKCALAQFQELVRGLE